MHLINYFAHSWSIGKGSRADGWNVCVQWGVAPDIHERPKLENSSLGTDISNILDSLRNGLTNLGANARRASASKPSDIETRRALLVLLKNGAASGESVLQSLESLSAGTWTPSESEIYPLLEELSEEGLLAFNVVKKVKVFSTTAEGDAWIAANPAATSEDEKRSGEGGARPQGLIQAKAEFAKASALLANAVTGVAISGSTENLKAATELISQTSRTLFSMLGKDD